MHEMTRLIRKASPAFRVSLFYCPRTYIFITKQRKTVIKMNLWELLILAVGLSMDAFAVSVCKGLSVKKLKAKHMLTVGAYFGGFQALMPLLGYILGIQFQSMIQQFDHWIAFVLLVLIGLSMIKESREEAENLNDSFSFKTMLPLAAASHRKLHFPVHAESQNASDRTEVLENAGQNRTGHQLYRRNDVHSFGDRYSHRQHFRREV